MEKRRASFIETVLCEAQRVSNGDATLAHARSVKKREARGELADRS
jgi:hypothetical protein